jgi:hypothetical protein
VTLHSGAEGILFKAAGSHPAIDGLQWEGTDLEQMRAEVLADVERVARRYFETDWEPAVATEINLYISDRTETRRVQLNFDVSSIHRDPDTPVGNRGETRVLKGRTPTVMIQRAHDQVFETGNSLSREDIMFSNENGTNVTRTISGDGYADNLRDLQDALESFSIKLMRRMAPDVVNGFGIPHPDDLVSIMRAALEDPERENRDEDEFRL